VIVMEECLSNHAVCRDFRSRKLRFPSPARPAGRAARTSPRGNGAGGGETDLVHDGIVAELKVEKTTTLSKDNVAQFLGQTTSYASGLGAQLRIAVILDLREEEPTWSPANVHWLEPKVHAVNDPNSA
jgi:hypothetical protein